jgi:hypothetical protein
MLAPLPPTTNHQPHSPSIPALPRPGPASHVHVSPCDQEMKEMKDAARSGTRPSLARRASDLHAKNMSRKASLSKQPSFNSGGAGGMAAGGGASSAPFTMREGELRRSPVHYLRYLYDHLSRHLSHHLSLHLSHHLSLRLTKQMSL